MFALLAAALLAPSDSPAADPKPAPAPPAAAEASTPLESAAPWWERITVVVDDKGKQQSCRYETSAAGAADCEPAMAASIKARGDTTAGRYSKVTFERRFSPGAKPDAAAMKPGDTLLGRQVMYLTIDAKGAIASCKVVEASGEVLPDYGCVEVRKEQFRALASADGAARPAFMTVLAYGHSELIA